MVQPRVSPAGRCRLAAGACQHAWLAAANLWWPGRTSYPPRNRVTSAASAFRAARVSASSRANGASTTWPRAMFQVAAALPPASANGRNSPLTVTIRRCGPTIESRKPSRAAMDRTRPAAVAVAARPPRAAGSPAARPGRPLAVSRRTGPGRAGHPEARCPPTGRGLGPPPGHARRGNAGPVHRAPPRGSSPAAVRLASPGPARRPGPVRLADLARSGPGCWPAPGCAPSPDLRSAPGSGDRSRS